MDLKSGGRVIVVVLLGLFAATNICSTETDTGAEIADIVWELDETLDDPTAFKDAFVVLGDEDPFYVEFVKEAITENLKIENEIYLKGPGKELQLIRHDENLAYRELTGNPDGSKQTLLQEIAEVLALDDSRYRVTALTKPSQEGETVGLDLLLSLIQAKRPHIDIIELEGARKKRQTSGGINVYQQIAAASGGMVIQTTKNNIASVVNLLKQTLKQNPVDIMRFDFNNPAGKNFKIPVDETMTQLTIQIQTPLTLPVAMIKMPSGLPAPLKGSAKPLGSKLEIFEYNITAADYGQWDVLKLAPSDWDVSVRGQSPVDFTHALMEPGPGGIGSYPIKGRPLSGQEYQLSVTVPQIDKIKNIFAAILVDNHNFPIKLASLTNVGGRRGKTMFRANLTIPTVDFKIAIDGLDKHNKQVRRLDPILISPISIRLKVDPMTGVKLYVNESINIPFTVTNEANMQQDVLIKIEDDKNFAQSPVFLFYPLKAGENITKYFVIKGGLVAGVTTTMTITAKPYVKGQQSKGQFEIRRFTVEDRNKKKNDTINPTCNVTSVTGTCKIGSDLCACVNHTWSMEVLIGDEGFGLQDIFPAGAGSNNSFWHENYTVGHTIDKGAIKASIGADCCHQLASIQVVDKAGNLAQCTPNITQNFTAPDPKVCNHTNVNQTIGCKKMSHTGACNFGSNPCDCKTQSWHIKVEFNQTNGIALHQAFSIGAGNNASLTRTGQIVELDVDCCQQEITVVGQDLAGNIGECNVTLPNYKGPNPNACSTTSTSTTVATTVTSTAASSVTTSATGSTASGATTKAAASNAVSTAASNSASGGSTAVGQTGTNNAKATASASASGVSGATTNVPASQGKSGVTFASGATLPPGVTQSPGATQPSGATLPSGASQPTAKPGAKATGTTSAGATNQAGVTNKPGTLTQGASGSASGATAASVQDVAEESSGVPESAVAAGMTVGFIGALSAVVVMAVLFKRALNKSSKSVDPNGGYKRSYDDRRDSAWS